MMDEKMFSELLDSIHEAGEIRRGEKKAERVTRFEAPDVKRIRAKLHLSQGGFASLLGISVRTLQNWEQGSRVPVGPSRKLLEVADAHPEVLLHSGKQK